MFPLLKYHGGKFHIKDFVISNFPSNYEELNYVEPFIGGGSILLNKKPSKNETACDINNNLIELWEVVKYLPMSLVLGVSVEYSEKNFFRALQNEFGSAECFYIKHRMSRGGLGKSFSKSDRLRGGQMGDKNAYENAVKSIPKIHNRIKDVQFKCTNFNITDYNSNTFIYMDPPYLKETRVSKVAYEYEMTDKAHAEMLDMVKHSSCSFLISGYNSKLYNDTLKNWNKVEKAVKNSSGQSKKKQNRTEVLWKNY